MAKKETKKPVKKEAKADKPPSKKTAAQPAKSKVPAKGAPKRDAVDFPIVGLGASAGGLEALKTFFAQDQKRRARRMSHLF
ncbi:MAG: hypothetical protein K9L83_10360 [Deltaproteobacteria bacterium]|nr:hypothetical protein [Deltaproteobacteria bacterium]